MTLRGNAVLPVAGIDVQALGGGIVAADQRLGQAMVVLDVVKPETAL